MQARDFDIITGQARRKYKSQNKPQLHTNSYDVLGLRKNYYLQRANTQTNSNLPKLGHSKDHFHNFHDSQPNLNNFQPFHDPINPGRLMNSVSTKYNIINHTKTTGQIYDKHLPETSRITFKKEAISKICDLGRLYAPNFNQEYQERIKQDDCVFRRKKGSCAEILEIGRSYGPRAKLFRKYK